MKDKLWKSQNPPPMRKVIEGLFVYEDVTHLSDEEIDRKLRGYHRTDFMFFLAMLFCFILVITVPIFAK